MPTDALSKDMDELKKELKHFKDYDVDPASMHLTMLSLSKKVDRLVEIFEESLNEMKDGGENFQDKLKPVTDVLQEIKEQNSQIAEGILTIADLIKELKQSKSSFVPQPPPPPIPRPRPFPPSMGGPLGGPKMPSIELPTEELPPPPVLKKKGLFR